MRLIYRRVRIAFYTFALGLAIVRTGPSSSLDDGFPVVSLPRARSSNVLLIRPTKENQSPTFDDSGDSGCANGIWDPARLDMDKKRNRK